MSKAIETNENGRFGLSATTLLYNSQFEAIIKEEIASICNVPIWHVFQKFPNVDELSPVRYRVSQTYGQIHN